MFFSYCRNIRKCSYRTFVIKQRLINNTQTTQFLSGQKMPNPKIYDSYRMTHHSSDGKVQRGLGVFGLVTNGLFRDNEDTNLEFRFRLRTFG